MGASRACVVEAVKGRQVPALLDLELAAAAEPGAVLPAGRAALGRGSAGPRTRPGWPAEAGEGEENLEDETMETEVLSEGSLDPQKHKLKTMHAQGIYEKVGQVT